MNIVRLVGAFPSFEKIQSGLGPTFYHLSREQTRLGANVYIICKAYTHQKKFEKIDNIHIRRTMTPYNIFALYELIKLKKRRKVDIVHAHATSGPLYAVLRKLLNKIWLNVGYVVHVHGTTKGVLAAHGKYLPHIISKATPAQKVRRYISILRENIVWKRADALIAVSSSAANELERLYGIPRERIHIVYNGVDLKTFYPRTSRAKILRSLGLTPRTHMILYLGGYRPLKGPTYLIKATEKIRERLKNVKVIFVGNPRHPLEKIHVKYTLNLIKRLKANDTIRVIENIPHIQLPEYYSAADVLIVPSIYDVFPKVVLEAMACGTPVIASAVGGLTEIIRNGETGVLVNPGNPDELAEAVINLILNADLRRKISFKARQLVREGFTWSRAAERIMNIYWELLEM